MVYRCKFCDLDYNIRRDWKRHLLRVHGIQTYGCDTCPESFYDEKDLLLHVESAHDGQVRHVCPHCSRSYKKRKDLAVHIDYKHKIDEPVACEKCGQEFHNTVAYKKHLQLQHKPKQVYHKCKKCPRSFRFKHHLKLHHDFDHSTDGKKLLRKYLKQLNVDKDALGDVSQCKLCKIKFKYSLDLIQHLKLNHSKKKMFSCCQCTGAVYESRASLGIHMRHEHGMLSHSCSKCPPPQKPSKTAPLKPKQIKLKKPVSAQPIKTSLNGQEKHCYIDKSILTLLTDNHSTANSSQGVSKSKAPWADRFIKENIPIDMDLCNINDQDFLNLRHNIKTVFNILSTVAPSRLKASRAPRMSSKPKIIGRNMNIVSLMFPSTHPVSRMPSLVPITSDSMDIVEEQAGVVETATIQPEIINMDCLSLDEGCLNSITNQTAMHGIETNISGLDESNDKEITVDTTKIRSLNNPTESSNKVKISKSPKKSLQNAKHDLVKQSRGRSKMVNGKQKVIKSKHKYCILNSSLKKETSVVIAEDVNVNLRIDNNTVSDGFDDCERRDANDTDMDILSSLNLIKKKFNVNYKIPKIKVRDFSKDMPALNAITSSNDALISTLEFNETFSDSSSINTAADVVDKEIALPESDISTDSDDTIAQIQAFLATEDSPTNINMISDISTTGSKEANDTAKIVLEKDKIKERISSKYFNKLSTEITPLKSSFESTSSVKNNLQQNKPTELDICQPELTLNNNKESVDKIQAIIEDCTVSDCSLNNKTMNMSKEEISDRNIDMKETKSYSLRNKSKQDNPKISNYNTRIKPISAQDLLVSTSGNKEAVSLYNTEEKQSSDVGDIKTSVKLNINSDNADKVHGEKTIDKEKYIGNTLETQTYSASTEDFSAFMAADELNPNKVFSKTLSSQNSDVLNNIVKDNNGICNNNERNQYNATPEANSTTESLNLNVCKEARTVKTKSSKYLNVTKKVTQIGDNKTLRQKSSCIKVSPSLFKNKDKPNTKLKSMDTSHVNICSNLSQSNTRSSRRIRHHDGMEITIDSSIQNSIGRINNVDKKNKCSPSIKIKQAMCKQALTEDTVDPLPELNVNSSVEIRTKNLIEQPTPINKDSFDNKKIVETKVDVNKENYVSDDNLKKNKTGANVVLSFDNNRSETLVSGNTQSDIENKNLRTQNMECFTVSENNTVLHSNINIEINNANNINEPQPTLLNKGISSSAIAPLNSDKIGKIASNSLELDTKTCIYDNTSNSEMPLRSQLNEMKSQDCNDNSLTVQPFINDKIIKMSISNKSKSLQVQKTRQVCGKPILTISKQKLRLGAPLKRVVFLPKSGKVQTNICNVNQSESTIKSCETEVINEVFSTNSVEGQKQMTKPQFKKAIVIRKDMIIKSNSSICKNNASSKANTSLTELQDIFKNPTSPSNATRMSMLLTKYRQNTHSDAEDRKVPEESKDITSNMISPQELVNIVNRNAIVSDTKTGYPSLSKVHNKHLHILKENKLTGGEKKSTALIPNASESKPHDADKGNSSKILKIILQKVDTLGPNEICNLDKNKDKENLLVCETSHGDCNMEYDSKLTESNTSADICNSETENNFTLMVDDNYCLPEKQQQLYVETELTDSMDVANYVDISTSSPNVSFEAPLHLDSPVTNVNVQREYNCKFCSLKCADEIVLLNHLTEVHANLDKKDFESDVINTLYKCSMCGDAFRLKCSLDRHVKEEHTSTNTFDCDQCRAVFLFKYHLKSHIKAEHAINVKKCVCDMCKVEFTDPNEMSSHRCVSPLYPQIEAESESTIKKHVSFSGVESVMNETSHKENVKRYNCDTCNMEFESGLSLYNHNRMLHMEAVYKCETCGTPFRNKRNYQRHKCKGTKIVCKKCNVTFINKELLLEHRKDKHNMGSLKCDYCSKYFKTNQNLMKHTKYKHLKTLEYTDPVSATYAKKSRNSQMSDIYNDLRIINQASNLPDGSNCDDGNMSHLLQNPPKENLLDTSDLSRTPQSLNSENIFNPRSPMLSCNSSKTKLNSSRELQRQSRIHRVPQRLYKCLKCPKKFPFKASLLKHIKNIHHLEPNKIYKCQNCCAVFKFEDKLEQHYKFKHTKMNSTEKNYTFSDLDESKTSSMLKPQCFTPVNASDSFNTSTPEREATLTSHSIQTPKIKRDEMFRCNECSAYLPSYESLQRHIQWEHQKEHKCGHCSEVFSTTEEFWKHLVNGHSQRIKELLPATQAESAPENSLKWKTQLVHNYKRQGD